MDVVCDECDDAIVEAGGGAVREWKIVWVGTNAQWRCCDRRQAGERDQ
jgi:hypothetical protein